MEGDIEKTGKIYNLLLLHSLPGIGKRRLMELLDSSPFLMNEPVNRNFWYFVERKLKKSFVSSEKDAFTRKVKMVLENAAKGCYGILHFFDKDYPSLLKQIYDPPLVLFYRGDKKFLSGQSVAVVGARLSTDYGVAVAEQISGRLAGAGLVIVSGMARGIDSAAHVGALRRSGKSVAVLGSGIDVVYPREAKKLYTQLVEEGCVVSEFFPGSWPAGKNFPLRNRIISGLSYAVLIVEASQRSGSLITARLALEQGRELLAVPGPVHSQLSVGTNYLIKQGAKLVQIWQDVVEELPLSVRNNIRWQPCVSLEETITERPLEGKKEKLPLTRDEEKVYKSLFFDKKVHLETLLETTGFRSGKLNNILLKLQFKDCIEEFPGHFYIKKVRM